MGYDTNARLSGDVVRGDHGRAACRQLCRPRVQALALSPVCGDQPSVKSVNCETRSRFTIVEGVSGLEKLKTIPATQTQELAVSSLGSAAKPSYSCREVDSKTTRARRC